ncbi:Vacuolar iron transporter cccA [Erysiphe necator]|uniref:Putative vacuolar iron transporter n=1 Tax=Uncinula necator TaxID=52586 RepID=A0A0B1P6P8_UNCNE|nr:Vacuolar iron transporter cccA [Erysiphe necator]KHJ34352.1 putative vacuolar iron transporter [Erysiphe necator]
MSLVGLINLLFHRTIVSEAKSQRTTRIPNASTTSAYKTSESRQWERDIQVPLLTSPTDSISQPTSDQFRDIESLKYVDLASSTEKQSKGFRIDARLISDATIGLSDGLTVPFALTAGLSAIGNTDVVIYGGLAELTAGAISMGLGGYLAATSEAASYRAQREKTENSLAANSEFFIQDIAEIFRPYNIPKQTINDLIKHLTDSPRVVDFVMQFKHCEEEPPASRAFVSAITIALGYFMGGMLPLIPYFFVDRVNSALLWSIGLMIVALFAFGYVKTGIIEGWRGDKNVRSCLYRGLQMVVVGGAAAAAAMGFVKLFQNSHSRDPIAV